MADCPHPDIRFCPLYVASHAVYSGKVMGCCWGDFEKGCAVEHKDATYADLIVELKAVDPWLVISCQTREIVKTARQQRARNMAALGLH